MLCVWIKAAWTQRDPLLMTVWQRALQVIDILGRTFCHMIS
ncbi:hypothetical protein C7476_1384 [Phyllobacterium bourgognense]|uniref:Uncharacterized protein n=1 Tax=Phyllobacterium bourgognense TaxID=314236 RepID=A0A368YBV1_9HYPH|nr:hypothetical protein C7476_1384 [Phyllobacterium bourgognense]